MAGAARRFARLVGQGLSLAIGRRPASRIELVGFEAFAGAWGVALLATLAVDAWLCDPPRVFYPEAAWMHAGFGLAWLVAARVAAWMLRRSAAWATLAALAMIAAIPWSALLMWLQDVPLPMTPTRVPTLAWLFAALVAALAMRVAWVVGAGAGAGRRLAAGLVFVVLLAGPWTVRADTYLFYPAEGVEDIGAPLASDARLVPEEVLGRQPALVAQRTGALAPQDPATIELFAVGFAGDGKESVFRNEVEYFEALAAHRFGATGHVVPLVNHPDTTGTVPLATLANLRAALAGVGARMDREQDVLLLFLTSHGSHDHVLSVDLPPLELQQVEPKDLRQALDDAGIRWRVVVVSACFSGGFIDALRSPETMVITAARADRTSFGCGADSEITWFGKAFLTEGLNRTTDLREAYAIAARRVREWEREDGATPSQPQIWAGERIDGKLAQWRATLAPGAPVAFVPAVPASAGKRDNAKQ